MEKHYGSLVFVLVGHGDNESAETLENCWAESRGILFPVLFKEKLGPGSFEREPETMIDDNVKVVGAR